VGRSGRKPEEGCWRLKAKKYPILAIPKLNDYVPY
jgi:hypothetical protein